MDLPERLTASLAALELLDGSVVVAVSGGPDSVALLDLLDRTRAMHRLEIIVAHADHGIHPESAAVAATVEALAASLGYPCEVGRLRLGAGASETAAREARYRWLQEVAVRHAAVAILTAHHADDQAETVLMRLLSGSGPAGLAGMAPRAGPLVRPLLPFRRSELAAISRAAGSRPGIIRQRRSGASALLASNGGHAGNRPPRAPGSGQPHPDRAPGTCRSQRVGSAAGCAAGA